MRGDVMGGKGMRGEGKGGEGMLEDEGEEVLSRVYLDVTQT